MNQNRFISLTWIAVGVANLWAATPGKSGVTYYEGMCDASAVIALDSRYQVVADDEDNVLRIYDLSTAGRPVWSSNYSQFLKVDRKEPEVDLEASARVGDRIYWISSHGRNKSARLRTSRHRFFATSIVDREGRPELVPVGNPCMRLVQDMLADPRLSPFRLDSSEKLAPKQDDGLNIEALAALPDGRLLIGFRNPQPFGKALLVPLENPEELLFGGRARFGEPLLLDLGGLGVRGLGEGDESLFIVAGSHGTDLRPAVYQWFYEGKKLVPLDLEFAGLNPESVEVIGGGDQKKLLFVSDDGSVRIGRKECKKLKDPRQKRFRTLTLEP